MSLLVLHCCVWSFSSCDKQGPLSSCAAQASHWGGFSCCKTGVSATQVQSLWCVDWVAQQPVGSSQTRDQTHIHMLLYLKQITKKGQGTLLNVMWQPGWERSLRDNGYIYVWMSHSVVHLKQYRSTVNWLCYYCCSVTQSCLTLCNPMDCRMAGLSVLHHVPDFAQVHAHCISDAIQPSHPLMPSSPSALNLCQHQGLFQWVGCSHQKTKMLELSVSISPSNEYSGLISLKIDWFDLFADKRLPGVFSSLTVWRHQFFSTLPSLWSSSNNYTWLLGRP